MRIIDYYNYIMTAACVLTCAAAVVIYKKKSAGKNAVSDMSDRMTYLLLTITICIATFLRLFLLGCVPNGLQQDEASIGYEAFALAKYGVDRNGYAYPVHPLAFGSGGNSELMIYLNMISVKLFGTGIVKLRLIPAILGIATVFVFFFVLKEVFSAPAFAGKKNTLSIVGTAFLAVCPWHVILSRWSLDSNIMPFLQIIGLYTFLVALRKKTAKSFALSAALLAIGMYGYGAGTMVIPMFIVIACIYALIKGALNVKKLIISAAVFMIIFMPLFLFYAVNYLGVPEIVTDYFCINKLTATRSGEVFLTLDSSLPQKLLNNLKVLGLVLTVGNDEDMLCHFYPGYATLFEFTFPITFTGLFLVFKDFFVGLKKKAEDDSEYLCNNAAFAAFLIANIVLSIAVETDISRMVTLFIPLVYAFVRGFDFILSNSKRLAAVLLIMVLLADISFVKDYFTDFNSKVISIFMPTYGDAVARAYEIAGDDRQVYSTYDGLSAPFIVALYYTDYNPIAFNDTVEYYDDEAMFRTAKSFGNFVFADIPENFESEEYENTVFVVSSAEVSRFEETGNYIVENMGGYSVAYKE
ncbi:Dolichyl-phosphate-mannose-protein mannosyltransferase [Butyrivibrio proteoclasticus]|uniref:Dolichyl-phosphate-mannose-protein mannosyltransferase n=1 Tax=Butyrivibrio proteoclasticus TaxID=43305 RepID=A0A1I5THS9_9FIRM|nr:glycosyltransferase family 39 protein [Butyrivibrio proteoclasticus]SFP82624.1 Dolichyl-phosphate-mannose-protein mannosyltransferase [Butyrivibrio proteoclasticus]